MWQTNKVTETRCIIIQLRRLNFFAGLGEVVREGDSEGETRGRAFEPASARRQHPQHDSLLVTAHQT
jgi:hypothetical protein